MLYGLLQNCKAMLLLNCLGSDATYAVQSVRFSAMRLCNG